MGYKYKVKEIEIGDVSTTSGVQTTVSDINPDTGSVSWDIKKVPNFDTVFSTFKKLRTQLTDLSSKTEDNTIDDMAMDIMSKFNEYRTHIRKNYPDIYRKTFAVNEAVFTNKFNIQSQDIGGLQKMGKFNSETSMPFNLVTNVEAGVNATDRDMVSKYFNDDVAILKFFPMEDSENDTIYDAVDKNGINTIKKLMSKEYGLNLVNPMILKGKKHCSADGEVCSVSHYLVFGKTNKPVMESKSGKDFELGTPAVFGGDRGEVVTNPKTQRAWTPLGFTNVDKGVRGINLYSSNTFIIPDWNKTKRYNQDVEEISTSGAAGAYLTPYAFRIPKKKKKTNEGTCGYDRDANTGKKLTTPGGLEETKSEDPGATLGPGPAAGEDGVKDNAYVKQFKYQLVPKDKKGNYVQKGSGLEVKNLF